MSDRDVEDVDLPVTAVASRKSLAMDRANAERSPWSSGTRSVRLVVFLVGSRQGFSRLCTLTRLLDAHDSPSTRSDHDSRSGAVASTDSMAASLRSSFMPWRAWSSRTISRNRVSVSG